MDYIIQTTEGEKGPFTLGQLRTMWEAGRLTKNDECREEDGDRWFPLGVLRAQLEAAPVAPAVVVPDNSAALRAEMRATAERQMNFEAGKKSGIGAALLNLVVPGAGYMYCGNIILGLFVFVMVIVLAVGTAGFALYVMMPIMFIDGFLAAGRANRNLAKKWG